MVFQDPFGSLNPVHRVRHHLVRPLDVHHLADGNADAAVADLLRRASRVRISARPLVGGTDGTVEGFRNASA